MCGSICILYCTHIRALRVRLEYRKSDAISDFTTNPKYFPKPGCGPELEYVGKRVGKGEFESLASKFRPSILGDRSATTRCPVLKRGGMSLESWMAGTARDTPGGRRFTPGQRRRASHSREAGNSTGGISARSHTLFQDRLSPRSDRFPHTRSSTRDRRRRSRQANRQIVCTVRP